MTIRDPYGAYYDIKHELDCEIDRARRGRSLDLEPIAYDRWDALADDAIVDSLDDSEDE